MAGLTPPIPVANKYTEQRSTNNVLAEVQAEKMRIESELVDMKCTLGLRWGRERYKSFETCL